MKLEFNIGIAVTAFTALLFYFRIAMLRGKKRRLAKEEMIEIMKMPKGKKQKERLAAQERKRNIPSFEVSSWVVIGIAIVLMLAGIVIRNTAGLEVPQILKDYWWVGPSAGFVLFMFGFK